MDLCGGIGGKRLHLHAFLLRGLPKIALHLKTQPEIRVRVECLCQTQGHVCGDPCPAVEYPRERRSHHSQMAGHLCHRPACKIVGEDFSRMSWVVHTHHGTLSLVIILIIDEDSVFALEGECKPPISIDADRIIPRKCA